MIRVKIFILDMTKILTIDQGTTSSRSIVFDSNANIVEVSQKEYPLIYPEDGISPGQACVFYKKDQYGHKVLGGGWIKE